MRQSWVLGLALVLVLAAGTLPAKADTYKFIFDEYGNGSYVSSADPTNWVPWIGTLKTDPSGGDPTALVYDLPTGIGSIVTGDVAILEPPNYSSDSDALRFGQYAAGGYYMIFYSDKDETVLAPADTGIPTDLNPSVTINEIGPEGSNYFDYAPGGAFPANNEYVGISEPEAQFLPLFGAMLGGLSLLRLRRRRS